MPKKFHEWREEAAQINAAAEANGEEPPIPDFSKLRLRPLAHKVLQARLNNYEVGNGNPERPD